MKKLSNTRSFLLILSFLIIGTFSATAQLSQGGMPASSRYNLSGDDLPRASLSLSSEQVQQKNDLLGLDQPGQPLFAGLAVKANLSPLKHGQWEVVDGKIHLWRQVIQVAGALGLGLNFDAFELREGAKLFVYNADKSLIIGSFDHHNNNPEQVFSTQIIPGETLIVEYQEPWYSGKTTRLESSLLNIESVIYLGYGGGLGMFGQEEKALGDAGDCQVNINCDEGNAWQDQKRGVARMLMRVGEGYFWCTGTLINNTAQDASPMFLSAAHCGSNATARDMLYWQFYFNYERPGCDNTGTPPQHLIVGAELLSLGPLAGGSDFRLLMLRQTPPAHWRPYWNGWNRTNNTSFSGVGIHHPSGDSKKISTYNVQLTSANPLVSGQQMASNSAWRVSWSPTTNGHGVVEGGSSGSPLFNSLGQVVGTLTGGSSTCENPYSPDYYGKMWYHWDKNGLSEAQRVAPFLDPLNTGQEFLGGLDPYKDDFPAPGFVSASLLENQQAQINWYQPGSAPNPEGWFSYVTSYSHLTWSSPERAVVFEAPYFGLTYPLTLSKVSHMFVEHSSYPWPNNQFTFKIYASDGATLLYESPVLVAASQQVKEHILDEPLVLDDYFYVAVKPVDASGHPSSLMLQVNFGAGYSFHGSADDWTAHNVNNMGGSYTYLTRIFVEGSKANEAVELSSTSLEKLMAGATNTRDTQASEAEIFNKNIQPSGYRVFRNGSNIHSTTNTEALTFSDNAPLSGLSYYHVTANYPGGESEPSARAYLLKADACSETISEFPYLQVFASNFDEDCWLDYGDNDWQLQTTLQVNGTGIQPAQGDQFYAIQSSTGTNPDQWLILPLTNFDGMASPALRFMFNGIQQDGGPMLNVWMSVDGGSFEKVWDSNMNASFASGNADLQWLSTTLNLKKAGQKENVRIAFQYIGEGEGFFALDKIEFLSAGAITYNVNISVNPDYSGTVTGNGTYLSGQQVVVRANPNLGYLFSGWIQGGNVLSTEPEYAFSMPGGNVNLTASFISDPTSVKLPEERASGFEAYPNPARDYISIRFNLAIPSAAIRLYNAQAQLVSLLEPGDIFPGEEHQLNLAGLPKGIYFIRIRGVDTEEVLKIIISD
ncbi:MAG: T9SS type A sorting domain-containing protein [Bacteroidales bacterium]|nr:T9SS type A sorting domain-containing protein [Bacteroidales bacterium]